MKRPEKAFTLVELLVVISIIALLLAILMPALAKVKEQGRTVVCATNLKNYGLAVAMYANSNNDKFSDRYWLYSEATWDTVKSNSTEGCMWHNNFYAPDGSLWPYLKDKNVHMCPTFRNFAYSGGLSICPNPGGHNNRMKFNPTFCYVSNLSLCWVDKWHNNFAPMKITAVKRPALCITFSEANLWTIGGDSYTRYNHPKRTGDGNKIYSSTVLGNTDLDLNAKRAFQDEGRDNIATYHKVSTAKCDYGVANIVYVDGHVKSRIGLAGYGAYYEYGRPYDGHEKIAEW